MADILNINLQIIYVTSVDTAPYPILVYTKPDYQTKQSSGEGHKVINYE